MPCLFCHTETHDTRDCTSNRARTVNEAVSHWIFAQLQHIYTADNSNSVYWLARANHLTRLSTGDLIYLMRDIMVDDPRYIVQRLIHTYLHFIVWTFYQAYHNDYSTKVQKRIKADIRFWYNLANSVCSLNEAEEIRFTELKPPYEVVKLPNTSECIQCAVCLNDGITTKNTHRYNCAHSFCLICSQTLLERENLQCPLCRGPIETVCEFIL